MKYVIGDIHGCLKTLEALVSQLDLSESDTLICVGDYINKGPCSSGVIDYIQDLRNKKFEVVTLMGNHEDDLLKYADNNSPEALELYVEEKQGDTSILEGGKIKPAYREFLESLEYYWMNEDYIVTHAGLNPNSANPLKDIDALLRIRKFNHGQKGFDGKRIIHGHDPTDLFVIKKAIKHKSWIIPLDAGCVYNKVIPGYEGLQFAHLCALQLDSLTLFVQPNVED